VIVFKNDSLAFVELEMKAAGILDFEQTCSTKFRKMAEAAGSWDSRPKLPMTLDHDCAALSHNGPALVEVKAAQELSMPRRLLLSRLRASAYFMLKAVSQRRGDEIVDLARINLFR